MREYKGYMGQVLRVDLTSETCIAEELPEGVARKYLGGTGLGMKYLYDEVPGNVQWSDEGNRIFIGGGVLSGTAVPGSGTISVVSRGPMTNQTAAAQANGLFGAFLRFCGYEGLIIQGKAKAWVYLHIKGDGTAELRDARHLLGKDTWETCDTIKSELGKSSRTMSVMCIGLCGENLVRFACPMVDKDHAPSKNGTGAVMGAKLLKAIAVDKGPLRPEFFDPDAFHDVAQEFKEGVPWTPFGNGTASAADGGGMAAGGSLLMYNYSKCYDPDPELVEKLHKFGSEYQRSTYMGKLDTTCWACNATHSYSLKLTEGPYAGEVCNEPEIENLMAFGSVIGNFDGSVATYLSTLVDKLGIDVNEAGWILAMAIECYEKGIVTTADTDGLELNWGNYRACEELLWKIARREGFGAILAEGAMRASQAIGGEAANCAVYTLNGASVRQLNFKKSWPYILDVCVGQNGTNEGMAFIGSASSIGIECSIGDGYRTVNGTFEQCVEFNTNLGWGAHLIDSLGVCWFPTNGDIANLAVAVRAATGWEFSHEEIIRIGKRIQNLMRSFNIRCGHTPDKDGPSPRLISPVNLPKQPYDLADRFEEMRDKYYEAMGWDVATSKPLPETLKALELDYVIPELWG